PFASAAAAFVNQLRLGHHQALATDLRTNAGLFSELIAKALQKAHAGARAIVFVDQFEELFTTVADISARDAFIEALGRLSKSGTGHVVITVRGDFYGRCIEHQQLARLLEGSTFPLSAPGISSLLEMITKPAARADLTFEDGLAQRILDDTGGEPGALALMA